MEIKELDQGHTDAAVRLWRACGLTRPWNDPAADFARALSGASSCVLGACGPTGELVGTVMVGHDGHRGWMYYLAVSPDHHRAGIGRRLVEAAERWVADRGLPKMMLMVRASNADVVAFYAGLGYDDQDTRVMGRFFDDALTAQRRAAH